MNNINHNFIHAFRNIKKSPVYSALTISGLTIGLTVFLLSALFIYGELNMDRSQVNHEHLYRLYDAEKGACNLDYDLAEIIRNNIPAIESSAVVDRFEWEMVLKSRSNSVTVKSGMSTSNQFFDLFDVDVLSKLEERLFSDHSVIILTKSIAKTLFGDDNPLGQNINLNNFFDVKVTAIIDDFSDNSSLGVDFLVNAENEDLRFSSTCNNGDCYFPTSVYVQVNDEVNPNEFISLFNANIKTHQTRVNEFSMQPLSDIYLSKALDGNGHKLGNLSFLKVLGLIAFIILMLSIINFVNFSLSLHRSKLKQLSIKKINGAGTHHLITYFMAETIQILIVVTVLSFILLHALASSVANIFGKVPDLSLIYSPSIIGILFGVVLLIILINSFVPLFASIRMSAIDGLNKKQKITKQQLTRPILTTIQFAASIVLLISVSFIAKQLKFLDTKDLGFDKENLLSINIPYEFPSVFALQQEVDRLNFVQSSSYSRGRPGAINLRMGSGIEGVEFWV